MGTRLVAWLIRQGVRILRPVVAPILAEAVKPLQEEIMQIRTGLGLEAPEPPTATRHDCGHESVDSAFNPKTGRTVCGACYRGTP